MPGRVNLDGHPQLLQLDLADGSVPEDGSCDIDVLIGSDYHCDVVDGDIIRGGEGLEAVSSRFGWLVSGPVKNDAVHWALLKSRIVRLCAESHCGLELTAK